MSKFCLNCGVALNDDAVFCSNCGASVQQAPASQEMPVQQQAPVYQQQPVNQAPTFVERIEDKAVSMWEYVGLLLLYSAFGWIPALIVMLVAKREALKTFSKGFLIFYFIAFVISIIVTIITFSVITNFLTEILNDVIGFGYSSYGY